MSLRRLDTLYITPGTPAERERVTQDMMNGVALMTATGRHIPIATATQAPPVSTVKQSFTATLSDAEILRIVRYYVTFTAADEAQALRVIRTRLAPVEAAFARCLTPGYLRSLITRMYHDAETRTTALERVNAICTKGGTPAVLKVAQRAALAVLVEAAVHTLAT